jgi:hypothetical protein
MECFSLDGGFVLFFIPALAASVVVCDGFEQSAMSEPTIVMFWTACQQASLLVVIGPVPNAAAEMPPKDFRRL